MLDDASRPLRRRASTIAEVAAAAGVAIGTVSRFLNGQDVRRGNREQIEAAIDRLSYRRNAVAAAMKTDRTHMVGLLIPTFDDFHSTMVERLAALIRTTSRALVMYCHSHDPRIIAEAVDFFVAQRSDAIIMDGIPDVSGQMQQVIDGGTPIIFYNNDVPDLAADRVMVDNRRASSDAVSHLLDLGHRRVAIVTGDLADSSGQQRLDGYRDALRARDVPLDPRLIVGGNWRPDSGHAAARHLHALDVQPTAVFLSNYGMAVGFLGWMKAQGLRVPGDLSIVSFDDIDAFRLHDAGITAVAQPIEDVAETLHAMLVSRLDGRDARPPQSVMLPCHLILRGSARPLRRTSGGSVKA